MLRETIATLRHSNYLTILLIMVISTQSINSVFQAWTPDPQPDYNLVVLPSVKGCDVLQYPQTENNQLLPNGTVIDTHTKQPSRDPLKWWMNCLSYQATGSPKLIPIFFNLALMPLVYLLTLQLTKDKLISFIAFTAFFFNPLYKDWINSGTYDQVWSFFLILSVYVNFKFRNTANSIVLFLVSLTAKPLGILYIPSILYGLKDNKTYIGITTLLLLGVIAGIIVSVVIFYPEKITHALGGSIKLNLDYQHAFTDNFGMLAYEIPFLMIFGYVSWKYSPKQPSPIRKLCAVWMINAWLTTTIIYLFSTQFQFVYRFVPLAVFMSIFIAITINDVGKWYIESKLNQVDDK